MDTFRYKSSLSQNFLTCEESILKAKKEIQQVVQDYPIETGIEIGVGQGSLTKILLQIPLKVHGFEVDLRLEEDLLNLKKTWPHFAFTLQNILLQKPNHSPQSTGCFGHLPYHLSTDILLWFLKNRQNFKFAFFLLQKEFAERIAAPYGSKTYGRLSVLTQLQCDTEIKTHLPAQAFTPQPKVDSAYLFLKPKPAKTEIDWKAFGRFTQVLFQQKRKKIKNTLKSYQIPEKDWEILKIDQNQRPETLSPEIIQRLFQHIQKK